MRHQVITDKLSELYNSETLQGKGGFWIKGHGFISLTKARKITGIKAKPRPQHARISAYGDYATIAAINGQLR